MNKFKESDRVRIKGGTLAGGEYIVEYKSEEPFNCDEDQYHIKNDQKPFGFDMREGNLELIEVEELTKSKLLFEQVMDGSYYNDEPYMEMATIASQDGVSIKVNQGVFSGKYDHMFHNDSRLKEAYVPSTQRMPETWKSESK